MCNPVYTAAEKETLPVGVRTSGGGEKVQKKTCTQEAQRQVQKVLIRKVTMH
jgi:hypothetical protein